MITSENINVKKLKAATSSLQVIRHPKRFAIIQLLEIEGQLTVTEIYTKLKLDQAAASNHLNMLKEFGILESRRNGKNTYYTIKDQALEKIVECIDKLTS